MKKSLLSLAIISLMVTSTASAQAQASEEIWSMVINNFGSALKADPVELAKFKAGLLSRDTDKVIEVLTKYAKADADVKVTEIKFLHPTNNDGTKFEFTPLEKNKIIDLISLRLDSLNPKDPSMSNKTFPFMVYDFAKGNHPYFVWTIKFPDEDAMAAQKQAMRSPTYGSGNTASTTTAATTNTGNVPQSGAQTTTAQVLTDANGKQYVWGQDATGQPERLYVSSQSAQGNGQSVQTQQAKADSTTRTYALNVTQSGDPDVLASLGGGQQQGQGADPAIPQKGWEKINFDGAERIMVYTPNGPFMLPKEQAPPQDQVEIIRPGRRGVIINHGADGEATVMTPVTEQAVMAMIRRLYNLPEQAPTSGSASAVASRNGIGYGYPAAGAYYQQVGLSYGVGVYGGVQIGVGGGNCGTCYSGNQTHVVPSAGGISGNGPDRFAQFQQHQNSYGK